nr:uncharacterized protein LOC127323999 [Lolium perenne]
MRALFWNIRGFGRRGRRTLLKEYLRLHRIDVVLLQETIKQDFTDAELASLEVGEKFFWSWLPANGQSGGMLLGVSDSLFEVGRMDRGQFFLSLSVLHRVSNKKMEVIGIYGPADHARSRGFLDEISVKIAGCTLPILMGGDFNLIRAAEDKSNDNLNWPLIDLLGSDHTPLVFDTGEGFPVRSNRFFFETSWFERHEFVPLVQHSWERLLTKVGGRDIIDWWNFMSTGLRQFLRGWNQNLGRDTKAEKAALLTQIAELDVLADATGLDEDAWASRYHLEEQLLHIYIMEEEHWRHRGREPARFLGPKGVWAGPFLMGEEARVSEEENGGLACTFSEPELEAIIKGMNTDTAPGPDGFPVMFFKRFWPQVKLGILHILNDFVLGRIDIARLNFGILSLIPKVPGAEQISQYRPIALINVVFKIISKAFASRLDPIAHRILSPNQTAFIKGRNILDGPLALMEIIHDLRKRKHSGVLLKLDFEKAYDRVNWDFLGEVLRYKGFDAGYIHRILQLVSGGQTAISINGEVGPFFRNKRGVRQGDPLSPLLFNFIGEALSVILSAAASAGHIHGLVPHLLPGVITHLQYADDTLILIQGSDEDIANLKFLLMCFEDMSGLKINYHKSEVFVLGQRISERNAIANKLNCKLGNFPFLYLGLPISNRKLTLEQWLFLVRKLAAKIEPWVGRLLTSGGRLILSNSCLDNLPIYAMGLFLLHDGIHARFDSHRSKFFWEGAGPKRKYHLVNWPTVCRPKEVGGLGLLNTKNMNLALLLKWIWRLYQDEDTIWTRIIRAKYVDASDLFSGFGHGGSPFWKSLHKIKHLFKVGAKHEVRNGIRTNFWKDWWIGRGPIMDSFPMLFAICDNQDISVAEALQHHSLQVRFRRSLDQEGARYWGELQGMLAHVSLGTSQDKVSWHLDQHGSFTVKSMYAQLSQGTTVAHSKDMWEARLPLKIKIFSWQLAIDKLPSGQQILTRHGPSNGLCALCGAPEDASHIFFACSLAMFSWRLLWVLFLAQSWALWNVRNKLAIEKKIISNPADIIYKITIFLQLWSLKAKAREKEGLSWMACELRELYVQLKPPAG